MKKNSFLYDELEDACASIGMSTTAWLKSNGFSTGTSTTLKSGTRPLIETVKSLSTKWNKDIGLRIIRAYLMDELDRIGASQANFAVEISRDGSQDDSCEAFCEDLKVIQHFMKHREIRRSIRALAEILKVSEWAQEDGFFDASDTVAQAEQDAVMHRLSATKKRDKQQNERTA